MTLFLNPSKYEEMAFMKDLQWRTKQVSTHAHDTLVKVNGFNRQWNPFRERGIKHRDNTKIEPLQTFEFPIIEGSGSIVNIWFTFIANILGLRKYYDSWEIRKKVYLRIYFDDEKKPSVDSPIGDFFGVGFGKYREYQSKYLEETSGGYICRFPMPFKRNARIEINNTSEEQSVEAFYGAITYRQYGKQISYEPFYFHAQYREEKPTTPEIPYKLFDANGEGFYAGCVLNQENVKRRDGLRFLEGNTKFYINGETKPSLEYTGTEDLFQGAWYYVGGSFSAPYHGCTIYSWRKAGIINLLRAGFRKNQVSQYRFHEYDAIPFQKSLLIFTHHGEFDEIPANQSSVTYFYARKPIQTNWRPLKKGEFPDEYYSKNDDAH
ncbi:MAG: glycoside hydrolase family 172 protein [Candidatus Hodarchaeota archaeon]